GTGGIWISGPFDLSTLDDLSGYTLEAVVTDAGGTTTQTRDFDLADTTPPEARNDAIVGTEDEIINGDIFADNGSGPDLDVGGSGDLTLVSASTSTDGPLRTDGQNVILPSGATIILRSDGTFSYNPSAFGNVITAFDALNDGDSLTDSFSYTIADSNGLPSSATVEITVNGVNDAPILDPDFFDVSENGSVTGNVLTDAATGAPDFDIEGDPFEVTALDGVALDDADEDPTRAGTQLTVGLGGELTIFADGSFTFDTAGAYDTRAEGTSLRQTVRYTVTDTGGASATTDLNLFVQGENDAPQTEDDDYQAAADTTLTINAFDGVLNGDFDAEGDALIVSLIEDVTNGTLTLNPDGSFEYTPNPGFGGTDSFTYVASDGLAQSDPAIVTIEVLGGTTVITPGGDPITGTAGNDVFQIAPASEPFTTTTFLASAGSDEYDLTANSETSFNEISYAGLSIPGIAVNIDANATENLIVKDTLGTDTIVNVQQSARWAFGVRGTSGNDTFNYTFSATAFSWLGVFYSGGNDVIDLDGSGGRLQIEFEPDSDVTANLSTGLITAANGESITVNVDPGSTDFTLGIDTGNGNDTVTGSDGDDFFRLGGGIDELDGGLGFDVVRYNFGRVEAGIDANLPDGEITGTYQGGVSFNHSVTNVERIIGSEFDDTLRASDADWDFNGNEGDDDLIGGLGDDTLRGGDGNDTLTPGDGRDFQFLRTGSGFDTVNLTGVTRGTVELWYGDLDNGIAATIDMSSGVGTVDKGDDGLDTLNDFDDPLINSALNIVGTPFDDEYAITLNDQSAYLYVRAGDGQDSFTLSGTGAVELDLGQTAANAEPSPEAANIDLRLSTGQILNDGFGNTETISNSGIALQFALSDLNDTAIAGDEGVLIVGRGGDDTLTGGAGRDTLAGSAGNDALAGGSGDDDLVGGSGNDTLTPGAGVNFQFVSPGEGFDTIDLAGATDGEVEVFYGDLGIAINATINLSAGVTTVDKDDAGFDTLNNLRDAITGDDPFGIVGSGEGDTFNVTLDDQDAHLLIRPEDGVDTFILAGEGIADFQLGRDLNFDSSPQAVTLDLTLGSGQIINDGFGNTETIPTTSLELEFSLSDLGDTATAGDTGVRFRGRGGNDTLIGGVGSDSLQGDGGDDWLQPGDGLFFQYINPGSGNDTIVFSGANIQDAEIDYQDINDTVTITIDQATNTGFADKGDDGFDTYVDINQALRGDFFQLTGTSGGDVYNINLTDNDTTIRFRSGMGNDTYNISETGDFRIRLDRGSDFGSVANFGANINLLLASSQIINDGFGSTDTIVGGRIDRFELTQNDDTVIGSDEAEELLGRDGADSLSGEGGDDRLEGEDGNDTLIGGDGNDTLIGGLGDDWIDPGTDSGTNGFDEIRAGGGSDTFDLRNVVSNTVSLEYGNVAGGIALTIDADANTGSVLKADGTDTILGIQNVANADGLIFQATDGNDSFLIDYANTYQLSTIVPGAGVDSYTLVADAPGDELGVDLDLGFDRFFNPLFGGVHVDLSFIAAEIRDDGFGNEEDITGNGAFREIRGSFGADTLIGDAGDNQFEARGGDDSLVGGAGIDLVDYGDRRVAQVDIDLGTGTASGVLDLSQFDIFDPIFFTTVELSGFENAVGSRDGNDQLFGSAADNFLRGRGGDDLIDGLEGNDFIEGNEGADNLFGGPDDDVLDAGPENDDGGFDFLDGGSGNDTLQGTQTALLYGGQGSDDLVDGLFSYEPQNIGSVFVNASVAQQSFGGTTVDARTAIDEFGDIDFLIGSSSSGIASPFDDVVWLDGGFVFARAGNDTVIDTFGGAQIFAGSGNDTITAGDQFTLVDYFDDGFDTAGGISQGIIADLEEGFVLDGWGGLDELNGVQSISGSQLSDTIVGSIGDDQITGGDGGDILDGGAGNDTLDPGSDSGNFEFDFILGSDGSDTIDFSNIVSNFQILNYSSFSSIDAVFDVDDNSATIAKATGTDTIVDIQNSNFNADGWEIFATSGNDTFYVDFGDNRSLAGYIYSGDGIDSYTVEGDFLGQRNGVRLDFGFGSDGELLNSVEVDLSLSSGQIIDDGFGNTETIFGQGMFEQIRGTFGADTLIGGDFDDNFFMRGGDDVAVGGLGFDLVDYTNFNVNVVNIDLEAGTASGTYDNPLPGGTPTDAFNASIVGFEAAAGSRQGDDIISGTADDNFLRGRGGADSLVGLGGNDTLEGDEGNDTLLAGDGDDELLDGSGNDSIVGGAGDDLFIVGGGVDTYEGGDGFDRLDADLSGIEPGSFIVDLDLAAGTIGVLGGNPASRDTISGVEELSVTGEIDVIMTGDSAGNGLYDGDGNDTLSGGEGTDTFRGSGGNDQIDGGDDFDRIFYDEAFGAINVNLATGFVSQDGFGGQDTLTNIERVIGSDFDDTIVGSGLDESFSGELGDDDIDGDGGRDFIFMGRALAALTIDLEAGTAFGEGNDTLTSIEDVSASDFNDTIFGSSADNFIDGGLGDDSIFGLGGNDFIEDGSGGRDFIDAGDGDDTISGQGGTDVYDGGDGIDTYIDDLLGLEIEPQEFEVFFDLTTNKHGSDLQDPTQYDDVLNIENYTLIGDFDVAATGDALDNVFTTDLGADTLSGGGGNDSLSAGAGDDQIEGGAGNDTLFGDLGADMLDGGAGDDLLRPGEGADTVAGGSGRDVLSLDWTADANGNFDFSGLDIDISGRYTGIEVISSEGNGQTDTLVLSVGNILDLTSTIDPLLDSLLLTVVGDAGDAVAVEGTGTVTNVGSDTDDEGRTLNTYEYSEGATVLATFAADAEMDVAVASPGG
ncbi:MAG: Ig-like domain-containing protein, partial [Pseudomonadota bacterium]